MAEEDEKYKNQLRIISELVRGCNNSGSVVSNTIGFYAYLLDDIILDVAVESHRLAHMGVDQNSTPEDETFDSPMPTPQVLQGWGAKNDRDIFGNSHPQVASDFIACGNCQRRVISGRFAPHLEKCMGKGRTTSRLAKRPASYLEVAVSAPLLASTPSASSGLQRSPAKSKLAPPSRPQGQIFSAGENSELELMKDGTFSEVFTEGELLGDSQSNGKRNRHASNKGKLRRKVRSLLADRVKLADFEVYLNLGSGSSLSSASSAIRQSAATFRKLTGHASLSKGASRLEDVRAVLECVCCVVSQRESTKDKICANSVNCPIHTSAQRLEVRQVLLPSSEASTPAMSRKSSTSRTNSKLHRHGHHLPSRLHSSHPPRPHSSPHHKRPQTAAPIPDIQDVPVADDLLSDFDSIIPEGLLGEDHGDELLMDDIMDF